MIVFGDDKYKDALISMWKLCFPDDTDTFVQFYFEHVYHCEETLIYLKNDFPVAALQIIPYPLRLGQSISLAGYISGAMTHPEFRKKGYMDHLLKKSLEVMHERDYSASFLIPQKEWLFNFYEKYGYTRAFPIADSFRFNEVDIPPRSVDSVVLRDKEVRIYNRMEEVDTADFYCIYYRFLTEKENVILKTKPQTDNILWDLFISGGSLFYSDWGIAFTFPEEKEVVIKEFFFHDKEIEREFLSTIRKYYPEKEIVLLDKENNPFSHYKGMIKSFSDNHTTDIYLGMMLD